MTSEQKKAFLLLKMVIFNYHGLDKDERRILQETAENIGALEELKWAYDLIGDDYYATHDKVKDFFNSTLATFDKETKVSYLNMVWGSNIKKGYISEMEATAMLKLAKEWGVQKELLELVRK